MSTSGIFDLVYEDNHIIVVNKYPGILVQGDHTGDKALDAILKEYLKKKHDKPGNVYLGVTHRIDRPTSGLVLFGKTSKATARLSKMFTKRAIQKTYWGIVPKTKQTEQKKTIINYLRKNAKINKSYASLTQKKDYKEAISHYKPIVSDKVSKEYQLLEITIETGRHHQIRCQLNSIGLYIKGDTKYGAPYPNKDKSISLHARKISFVHPVTKKLISIKVKPPKEFYSFGGF